MDSEIKRRIDNCFSWNNDPTNAYGAPALMEQEGYWDEIDLNDDDDVEALMELAMRSMRMSSEPNTEFVEYLISKGFDINSKVVGKSCLLLQGADNWLDVAVIQKLVDLGADVYAESSDGYNALLLSARKEYRADEEEERGALPIYLVENFDLAQFDKTDKFGITPLMYAAMNNHIKLAQALIKHGSDVNAVGAPPVGKNSYWINMDGVTPLALACRCGNVEIANMLLEAGADETLRDSRGNPPIFSLLRYPHNFFQYSRYNDPIYKRKSEILSMLKNAELTDAQGYTALMRSMCDSSDHFDKASAYDNLPIALALMERGVNIEATGNDGRRALHWAVLAFGDVEKKLIKAGAELNVQDREGNTPLLIACRYGNEKVVRYLIKSGADITLKNNKGETAMDIAVERGFSDAVELMMEQG